jgi:chemosensory pili system protein ChpA (sensor histidine kinase/response regulator)
VRQAATDTHKKAELHIEGASGELDRQVLERMMPPFEHMLRNAVAHGIESPEERKKKGKNESGTITIALHREGSEVVVEVSDDGGGMNLKAIRDKGISLGLVRADQQLSDDDIMQLILEPGFSTAGQVSTLSGRGVGMDVVAERDQEARRRAAHGDPSRARARASRSACRSTLAISHALILRANDELYALPLPTVEGVVRLSRTEVEAHLGPEAPPFEYGGTESTSSSTWRSTSGASPVRCRWRRDRARDPGARRRTLDRPRHRRAGRQPRDRGEERRSADRGDRGISGARSSATAAS